MDGFAFEVVAEREITEHFKEGHVSGGTSDVIDIAGADAHLASGGFFESRVAQAHEFAFELVHPGGGEKHCWVVGDQDITRLANTAFGFKER